MGIAPDQLENVMEPFFTTKEPGKGSGLGLSMVYGFAKQSSGAFRLTSEVGVGTKAELWLPRAEELDSNPQSANIEEAHSGSSRALRIFLIDDHDEVRSTTAALLADLGHEIMEAASGAEALTKIESGECEYDVIISDYAMPHLSGTEFLRKARELCPKVPALIITGYAEAEAISDRPDGVEVLQKPFTQAKLDEALSRLCRADFAQG
jgi:CheY-like chemotaxis protein